MKLKEWGAFALLGLIWGSSFMWIKIALNEVGPLVLVALRLLFGVAGLLAIMLATRSRFPRDRKTLLAFGFAAVVQTALPFVLISWGETRIDSGLASILNATVPLFTIVIAHFWLHDEKITLPRIAGLVVGFTGVVILVSRDMVAGGLRGSMLGQLAVLGAALSYGVGITFARKYMRGHTPIVQSAMVLLFADAMVWVLVPLERPLVFPFASITWLALAWLGLLGSCTAYLLYYYLIGAWGATRASVVTYVLPVFGLLLGILFLDEKLDVRLIVGSILVVAGIAVVNVRWRLRKTALAASSAGE